MCKFTNRLFVFTFLALIGVPKLALVQSTVIRTNQKNGAADGKFLDYLFEDYDNNADIHYDQRQKGNENLRVRMDGFFIELPPNEKEEDGAEDVIKEIYVDLLLSLTDGQSNRGSSGGGSSAANKSTLPPIDITHRVEHESSKEKKLNLERHADVRDAIEEAIAKHDVEGRNVGAIRESNGLLSVNREPEGRRVGAITKQHFGTLLNLLRRLRQN